MPLTVLLPVLAPSRLMVVWRLVAVLAVIAPDRVNVTAELVASFLKVYPIAVLEGALKEIGAATICELATAAAMLMLFPNEGVPPAPVPRRTKPDPAFVPMV